MIKEIFKLASLGKYKDAAKLIRSLIDNKEDISGAGVHFAHILLLAADWNYIEALLPKNTNTFSRSGHLLSVSTMRPMNGEGKPIPWFTYPAIDFLDRTFLIRDDDIIEPSNCARRGDGAPGVPARRRDDRHPFLQIPGINGSLQDITRNSILNAT